MEYGPTIKCKYTLSREREHRAARGRSRALYYSNPVIIGNYEQCWVHKCLRKILSIFCHAKHRRTLLNSIQTSDYLWIESSKPTFSSYSIAVTSVINVSGVWIRVRSFHLPNTGSRPLDYSLEHFEIFICSIMKSVEKSPPLGMSACVVGAFTNI